MTVWKSYRLQAPSLTDNNTFTFEQNKFQMVVIIKRTDSIEKIRKIMKRIKPRRKSRYAKYVGILKKRINPDEYQKKMRDEWE